MSEDSDPPVNRTPVPTDIQHAKILIGRTLRKDAQKPQLYAAKFISIPIMFMLYCVGFLIAGQDIDDEGSVVQGGYELFPGQDWTYPNQIRLGGFDNVFVESVSDSLGSLFDQGTLEEFDLEVFKSTNYSAFHESCQDIASDASSEVCVYFNATDDYIIHYGGNQDMSPYQPALAGAQWAINNALLNIASPDADNILDQYHVAQIQHVPLVASESAVEPLAIVLLLPPVMHALACATGYQFMVGPVSNEKINQVAEPFYYVGVKMRTYLLQWVFYFAMNLPITAAIMTFVSEYWYIMPMSSPGLIFISHYLGFVALAAQLTLLLQFVGQEELANGVPFLSALFSIAIGTPLLNGGHADSVLMYILSVPFPLVGIFQYYGLYITYDYTAYDTGIVFGENVVSSGLLGSFIAQAVSIVFYIVLFCLYSSASFSDWLMGSHPEREEEGVDTGDIGQLSGEKFEPLPPNAEVVVSVRGVGHMYQPSRFECDRSRKPVQVLDGLNMDICRGEVFGYLGHNGAGKTTSVNILADQLRLQRGKVSYNFKQGTHTLDATSDVHHIRNKIGVCPQHNSSLQEDLTARETLRLFAHLKGGIAVKSGQTVRQAVEAEVDRRLVDVKFTSVGDSDKPIKTYSGGMKRKVLIAMALLGDPELVFLDEPTAGLDPYNRRSIWDMIIDAKKGRSIILTTHFLDEADVLSDRIGIIKDGSLVTCGSSLFLKHAFGVGYTLTFEASITHDLTQIIEQAIPVPTEQQEKHEWRLAHGTENRFSSALQFLADKGVRNLQLDLTTLEEVFLETGKETRNENDGSPTPLGGTDTASSSHEELDMIWDSRCPITPLSWWDKLFLVQHFMMLNAWKVKGSILLNLALPLVYLIAGVTVSVMFETEGLGEVVIGTPIELTPYLAGDAPSKFFGIPTIPGTNPIPPLVPSQTPQSIEDYFSNAMLPVIGGLYASNATLQYSEALSPFSLQIATMVVSDYSAFFSSNSTGISTTLEQLPYVKEADFRTDLLFVPLCLVFGFSGLVFSVLDVLLLKADNVVGLFRVSGITEWTAYLGVTMYKLTTTFLPFFVVLVALALPLGIVIFGNAGRWLASILLMFAYAYSATPFGLLLAKRFITGDYKSVTNWFPGMYYTFSGVPYIAYATLRQALPDSESIILIIGDILCLIPQIAFQRGLGAVLDISDVSNDKDLHWDDVWSFEQRVWFALLMMIFVGTMEWWYLYALTTSRPQTTKLSDEELQMNAIGRMDASGDDDVVAERERSLASDEGINAKDIHKIFRVVDKHTKTRSIKRAVKGISFGIRKNEIFALLGPNGAGKTVTMSVFAGQVTPEHGEVSVEGRSIGAQEGNADELFRDGNVAYVPQFDALFPNQTVNEHLKFYACIRGLKWDEDATQDHVNSIVKLLGLQNHRQKPSNALSGGYKRRLSLAVALLGYPKALLLDEVTTGLDPAARRLIWDVLKPINQRSYDIPAILLSTHYMEEAEMLGNRIGIMIDGEFAATGSLGRLYNRFCTSFFVDVSFRPKPEHNSMEGEMTETFRSQGMSCRVYESLPHHLKLQIPFSNSGGDPENIGQLAKIFETMSEQDDENMTPQEREDWLRSRGIQIETPEDRRDASKENSVLNALAAVSIQGENVDGNDDDSIPFVLIPQDDNKSIQTLKLPRSLAQDSVGDALPDFCKPYFADNKSIDATLLSEQATKQFAGGDLQGLSKTNISASAMNAVAAQGSVETFPLVHPADTNNFQGVYIYLDEVGLLKKLPLNRRASAIAEACGYSPAPQFFGDVFVGRVQTKPRLSNVPFEAGVDTDRGAAWMQRAVAENLAWQQEMNRVSGKSGQTQPSAIGTEGKAAVEDSFEWTQEDDEVELSVSLTSDSSAGSKVDKKSIKVTFLPKSIKVTYKGLEMVNLSLYGSIDVDGCTWTVGNGKLVISCEKASSGMWPRITN
eukprot:Nitzschia sp. Nitz4//scaffold351_size16537//459//7245//NITZ4_008851-RA/size16537-augustus-gene-0.0-mRNA-1//1//CDS//3329548881//4844//frame0